MWQQFLKFHTQEERNILGQAEFNYVHTHTRVLIQALLKTEHWTQWCPTLKEMIRN